MPVARVSLAPHLEQVRASSPASVQVAARLVDQSPKLWPRAEVARVSFAPHLEQVRASSPASVQVAARLVDQSPKLWPRAGMD